MNTARTAETIMASPVCWPSVQRRVLLRTAFDGSRFHGTQRQPDVPTVNQGILDVLGDGKLLAEPPNLRAQGRVDSGVSARDHPLALDVTADLDTVARALAGRAEGIVPWAGARVQPGFDPRFATRSRTYRYHLPDVEDLDADAVRGVWRRFEGRHDVSAFARIQPAEREQDPHRTITRSRAWRAGEGLVLEVTAPSFLRHQVRRMVGAACLVGRGQLEPGMIDDALAGGALPTHETAPSEGLILWRVGLSADWMALPEAEAIARGKLRAAREQLAQRSIALEAAMWPRGAP